MQHYFHIKWEDEEISAAVFELGRVPFRFGVRVAFRGH